MKDEQKFEKKKSLGQHFLTSSIVPKWMCDAANIVTGDIVIEVGPGTGALTRELLARGATVIALEADKRAIAVLKENFADACASGSLILHHTDVRTLDLSTYNIIDRQFKVVANIPYYLSGMLFRTFLESDIQPSTLVFLVQKEVAWRISRDEKESLLSLSVKAFGTPHYVRTVSKGHFTPSPKIDSAIIAITEINNNNFNTIAKEKFFEILHLGFGQKRKQLLGNMSKQFDREALTHIFSTLEIPQKTRAEDLSLEKWLELVKKLYS